MYLTEESLFTHFLMLLIIFSMLSHLWIPSYRRPCKWLVNTSSNLSKLNQQAIFYTVFTKHIIFTIVVFFRAATSADQMLKAFLVIGPTPSRLTRPEVHLEAVRANCPRQVLHRRTGSNRRDALCFKTDHGRTFETVLGS